ncbi:MAG: hypothetical protein AAGM84_15710 [Pseudomonadota bacterium]
MCLSSAALAAFLSILGPDNVTLGDATVTVHAEQSDAVWTARADQWCTLAPRQPLKAKYRKKSAT